MKPETDQTNAEPEPKPPTLAATRVPFIRALEGTYLPCDYPEDSSNENGNYASICACGNNFIGHKRRILCKTCAEAPSQPDPKPGDVGVWEAKGLKCEVRLNESDERSEYRFIDLPAGHTSTLRLCDIQWHRRLAVVPEDKGETSDGYHTFNELYEHRHALFLALMAKQNKSAWASALHDDGSSMAGWFIAGIDLPTGTITYHLPDRLWELAIQTGAKIIGRAPKWDGHTSDDVVKRLKAAVVPEADACRWSYDEHHYAWDGQCGAKWQFMDDGPVENEMRFCPGCGRRVEAKEGEG